MKHKYLTIFERICFLYLVAFDGRVSMVIVAVVYVMIVFMVVVAFFAVLVVMVARGYIVVVVFQDIPLL